MMTRERFLKFSQTSSSSLTIPAESAATSLLPLPAQASEDTKKRPEARLLRRVGGRAGGEAVAAAAEAAAGPAGRAASPL